MSLKREGPPGTTKEPSTVHFLIHVLGSDLYQCPGQSLIQFQVQML